MCYVAVGFTTDGDWNSLHIKGYSRPLSIFQICADVRYKFSHESEENDYNDYTSMYDSFN